MPGVESLARRAESGLSSAFWFVAFRSQLSSPLVYLLLRVRQWPINNCQINSRRVGSAEELLIKREWLSPEPQ